ncbi:hypothetical protein [Neptunicella sp. SCSIO 80796]|uniref:hypothetical protein n=1 Tax=Neptunicella plasticusilytica TaxID=3117012 RepID=UPI003A4E4451
MNLTAIAIVAIVFFGFAEIIKQFKKKSPPSSQPNEGLEKEINALKERIETLEKIVTDENYDLKKQFDSLKD